MPKTTKIIMKKSVQQVSVPGFRNGRFPKSSSSDSSIIDPGETMNKTITRYVGSDWLKKLENIIGNLMTIDDSIYKESIEKISICESNIQKLFKRILKNTTENKELNQVYENFQKLSTDLDIKNKSYVSKLNKKGKPHDVLVSSYVPQQLILTEWFKLIKDIEKTIYKFIEKIFISADGESKIDRTSKIRREFIKDYPFEKLEEQFSKYPDLKKLCDIYGIIPENELIYSSFLDMQKFSNIIINILLTPMYDVEAKITSNYDKQLAAAFKPLISKSKFTTKELIIELLTNFAIAQYRSTITGNNKYFIQMLSGELTEGKLSEMDGARFMEVMDTINTDSLEKGSKAQFFTEKAKVLMKKMIEQDGKFDMKILEDVRELIGDEEVQKSLPADSELPSLPAELETIIGQFDDMFVHSEERTEGTEDSSKE